ncbi:MAG TPA: hypothetical protein VMD75_08175 [Candidatus Binataceae bacterium]|jgi:hypothetical protein|nr:hypothetical protein [Candidatus Binataceae bacterium]
MDRAKFVELIGKPLAGVDAGQIIAGAARQAERPVGLRANLAIMRTSIQTPFNLPPSYAN